MRRTDLLILTTLAGLVATAAILLGGTWRPTFDEYWILYYGEVEPLGFLVDELKRDNHPFPFYALVRLFTEPSWPPLCGRLAATLCAVLTLPFVFALLRGLAMSRVAAHVGTAVLATSLPFMTMAVCARSYSLATLFVFAAAACLVRAHATRTSRPLAAAVAFAALAPWPLYSAAFPIAGLFAATALVAIGHRPTRAWLLDATRANTVRAAVGFAIVSAVLLFLYFKWSERPLLANYLAAFFPRADESAIAFVIRGTNANLRAFFGLPLGDENALGPILAASVLGGALLAARRTPTLGIVAAATAIAWFGVAAAAIAGKHPYGGIARHQYVLYPLPLVVLIALVAHVLRRAGRTPVERAVAVGCVGGALSVLAWLGPPFEAFERAPLFEADYRAVAGELRDGDALLVDRYSYLALYGLARRESGWRHREHVAIGENGYDLVDATLGGRRVTLVRDNADWHDYRGRSPIVARAAPILERLGHAPASVLVLRHESGDMPSDRDARERAIADAARTGGLSLREHRWLAQGEWLRIDR